MQKNTIIGVIVLALIAFGLIALFRQDPVDTDINSDTSSLDGSNQMGSALQAGASTGDNLYDESGNLTDVEQSAANAIQAEGK